MTYAKKTAVPIGRTQDEIRRTLERYHATGFAFGEQGDRSIVMFHMKARMVKFVLPMPPKPSAGATKASQDAYAQLCKSRWRGLLLAIKAKLESVESGLATFEQEFMAQIVLPGGKTVGDVMKPQIDAAYISGKMPPLLGYDT